MQQVNCQNIKSQPKKYRLSIFNTDELIKRPFFSDIKDKKSVKNANMDGIHIEDKKIVEVVRNLETENNSFQNGMTTLNSSSPSHNSTQYIPLRNPHSFNISDLISNEAVSLESNVSLDEGKVFIYSTELNEKSKKPNQEPERLLISYFLDIQGPNETLNNVDATVVNRPHNAQNSSHTADNSSPVDPFESFNGISSFHELENDGCNAVDFSSQEFVPGVLILSKLKLDEISCANGFAAIPKKLQTLGTTENLNDINVSNNLDSRITLK
uniref:Uncharacterized protein n=1 Tax=Glossina austeni TaxID=7395 RepID=A0A1A9UP17_GLOAU